MWDAAQLWVVQNSGYRLQTTTDVVIQTFGPIDYSTDLAAQVTKEPNGNNRYRIIVSLYCANLLGCFPNPRPMAVNFNRVVSAAGSNN